MKARLVLGATVMGLLGLVPLTASAAPPVPTCVVVDQAPLQVQVGYAPDGPSDCAALP